jgi:predicted histone-like DNA-binding protein
MSVKFNVVERGNPSKPTDPKKFYPSVVSSGKVGQRDVARRASEQSTVSMADTAAVIENFLSIITDELSRGNIVHLGEFGSFWVRVETEGAEVATDVTTHNIKGVMARFTPGKEFQEALDKITFEKA